MILILTIGLGFAAHIHQTWARLCPTGTECQALQWTCSRDRNGPASQLSNVVISISVLNPNLETSVFKPQKKNVFKFQFTYFSAIVAFILWFCTSLSSIEGVTLL